MAARGPQNGRGGLERCLPLGFWRSKQLLLNKFFDPSTPSKRKGLDGEKNVIASCRLPERRPLERRKFVPIPGFYQEFLI